MKILMTGATGLVGQALGKKLTAQGHSLFVISRNPTRHLPFACEMIAGNLPESPVLDERLQSVEAVIHLLGENVGEGRWTSAKKEKILSSRVEGTRNLFQSLQMKNLKVIVSASAIGYYGDRGNEELNEASSQGFLQDEDAGTVFLSKVCQEWEATVESEAQNFSKEISTIQPLRWVILRTGMVLSGQGGALPKMIQPAKMGLSMPLGSGEQWISWVHIDDLVRMYLTALENPQMEGIYNAVSPHPVRNKEFIARLAHVLGRPQFLRLPSFASEFALKLALGEMATLVLSSQRVQPQRFLSEDFEFEFSELDSALKNLCSDLCSKEV